MSTKPELKKTKDRSDYWNGYWSENKEKILGQRREKYKDDPDYREKLKQIRKRNYEKNKILKSRRPETEYIVPENKPVVMDVNGRKRLMYDIYYFSKRIDRSPITIKYWERKGILPKTHFRVHRRCAYSKEMIDAVYDALAEQGFPGNINVEEFADYVAARWQALEAI